MSQRGRVSVWRTRCGFGPSGLGGRRRGRRGGRGRCPGRGPRSRGAAGGLSGAAGASMSGRLAALSSGAAGMLSRYTVHRAAWGEGQASAKPDASER